MALPMVEEAGEGYIEQDENDTGRDDLTGQALVAAARLLKAALTGDENALRTALKR